MKRVFLIIVIVVLNGMFTSCTDLDENLYQNPIELEGTGGEEDHIPVEEDTIPPVRVNFDIDLVN